MIEYNIVVFQKQPSGSLGSLLHKYKFYPENKKYFQEKIGQNQLMSF